MNKSENIRTLAKSLVAFQSELTTITKNKENPFFKSSYADLAGVVEAIRETLAKHKLAVVQTTGVIPPHANVVDNGRTITTLNTTLLHESGEFITGQYPINPVKNDPQGIGSAITYARRYALMAILGAVAHDEDDDGNASSHHPEATEAIEKVNNTFKTKTTTGKKKFTPRKGCISEKQSKRFFALALGNNKTFDEIKAKLKEVVGDVDTSLVKWGDQYEKLCAWAEGKEITVEDGPDEAHEPVDENGEPIPF